jgi:hypothetical protein
MAATAGHRLTFDPMGKCSNAFFPETSNMIKAKLHECSLDGPLQTLGFLFRYEIQNGGYGRTKFNFGPYGKNVSKRFFSVTKLPRNDHWKVLHKVSVFYADRKSKMTATTGHSINTGPYGENTEICSSLKLLH